MLELVLISVLMWLQRLSTTGVDKQITPMSFLHIDCDLYAGAHDALTLLAHKVVPGTVILFDELVNYKLYRLHEVKALFEWLQVSGAKIAPIAISGPIQGTTHAMDINMEVKTHEKPNQAAAFLVMSLPGHASPWAGRHRSW